MFGTHLDPLQGGKQGRWFPKENDGGETDRCVCPLSCEPSLTFPEEPSASS